MEGRIINLIGGLYLLNGSIEPVEKEVAPIVFGCGRKRKKEKKYIRNKKGELIDLSKEKYKKVYEIHGTVEEFVPDSEIEENALNRKVIKVYKQIAEDSDRAPLGVIKGYDEFGKIKFFFKFSHKQMWKFKDAISSIFLHLIPWDDSDIDVCNEVKVYIAFLREPEFMISADHLVKMGVKKCSANSILETLTKRGTLIPCGMVGKRKFYTCAISRERLAEMFKPYEVEE